MKTETKTVTITGTVTNDPWGNDPRGPEDCEYVHGDSDYFSTSILEVMNEFRGKTVTITISG